MAITFRPKPSKVNKIHVPEGPNYVNLTDMDSALMTNKRGTIQGYNPQIGADANGIILGALVSNNSSDKVSAVPMIEQIVGNFGLPEIVTMDNGYFSIFNVNHPSFRGITLLTPPCRPRAGETSNETIQAMRDKLKEPDMKALYNRRSVIAEPPFSRIKCGMGFTRFLMRGLECVSGEWDLVTTAHNVMKIFSWLA
jgi:hypothetical protein